MTLIYTRAGCPQMCPNRMQTASQAQDGGMSVRAGVQCLMHLLQIYML